MKDKSQTLSSKHNSCGNYTGSHSIPVDGKVYFLIFFF